MSQGSNGPGMAQGSRASARHLNAGFFHVISDDPGNSQAAEWLEGGLGAQEHFPEWCLSKSMLEISNDGFSDRFKQWQRHFLSAFLRTDADSRLLPVVSSKSNSAAEMPRMP